MKVSDFVRFSKENYFNGAVQTDWFYETERRQVIAGSFVFHGPKYYGVSSEDVAHTQHKLIDSASFVKTITDKLYTPEPDNNFIMTIAGYGTGKSHLAVTLGTLFSKDVKSASQIIKNISEADINIGEYIKEIHTKRNIVIALNGMNNYNLDAEVLKCARMFLQQNGISNEVLKKITKSYMIATHFVERMFDICEAQFEREASVAGLSCTGAALKKYLLSHIENESGVLQIINRVYEEMNGDSIRWDRGLSAGDVLTVLQQELCGDGKPFHKLLVLFDEFGRYIEYAAANPTIAGEAALQQIFEAAQSAKGKVIFVGFIQNDLSAYLTRIDKTSNIIRYVGRYENSEKLYLSSNFETVLANLLKKECRFDGMMGKILEQHKFFYSKMFQALGRWDRSSQKKRLWTDEKLYNNVILKGCYPLHPITVWLLSHTSSWMQQRSTIAFVAEMFEMIENTEIDGTWLPYIYPIDLVDSTIYYEMLNSEEKGLVQSQHCMLYKNILTKLDGKLSETENRVLKAVLIINIGRFIFWDKEDAVRAIQFCTNEKEENVVSALKSLENLHGVVAYDDHAKTFDLMAEANGFNEFKRVLMRYRQGVSATIDDCGSDLLKELSLTSRVETDFAQIHNISSPEWSFEKLLINIEEIGKEFFIQYIRSLSGNYLGEKPRGQLVYAYCSSNAEREILRVSALYQEHGMQNYPLILLFLDDAEQDVLKSLTIKKILSKFSAADRDRLEKYITGQEREQNKKICQKFSQMVMRRQIINASGVENYSGRLSDLCTARFGELYRLAPPFAFDGFQNKITTQPKKYLANICIKMFDRTLMNIQSYQALTSEEKNRIKACLSTKTETSWKVFDDNCSLIEPQEMMIRTIYDEVESELKEGQMKSVFSVMGKYTNVPYGMNINAVALFVFYFIAQQGRKVVCYYGQERLLPSHLSNHIFKQSKLQPNEFLKIRIGFNADVGTNVVQEICKEALRNTEIESCSSIKERLLIAIEQEGELEENKMLVGKAKVCLDTGIALNKAVNEKLKQANKIVEEAEKGLVLSKLAQVFDKIWDESKSLSEEYSFVCGERLKQEIQVIRKKIDVILQKQFETALARITCNITQISQMKQRYKKTSEIYRNNHYSDYAEAIEKRVSVVEKEVLVKERYKNILKDLEKDLTIQGNHLEFDYKKTMEILEKMHGWKEFVLNADDLPESMSDLWIERIETTILSLQNRQKILNEKFNEGIKKFDEADCLEAILSAERELRYLEGQGYGEEKEELLASKLAVITYIKEKVGGLPSSLDELKALRLDDFSNGRKVIENEIVQMIKKCENDQKLWIENYIVAVEENVSQMDAVECTSWMERTKSLPKYVSTDVEGRYHIAYGKVEERLHMCKVEGVVSLFNKLSIEEKKQCLAILLKSFGDDKYQKVINERRT